MTKSNLIVLFSVFVLISAVGFYGISSSPTVKPEFKDMALRPKSLETIRIGKVIYLEHCASCHGVNLEGQDNWRKRLANGMLPAPPHDETGHTWHHDDAYLFLITKYGIEKLIGKKYPNAMPVYEDILNDQEIISVLSYIKSTWPAEIQGRHNQLNLRAKG